MPMTREKMKEVQSLQPQKRYFTLNRAAVVKRAEDTLVNLVLHGDDPMRVWHKFFAPLTKDELKSLRQAVANAVNEAREAKFAKENQ